MNLTDQADQADQELWLGDELISTYLTRPSGDLEQGYESRHVPIWLITHFLKVCRTLRTQIAKRCRRARRPNIDADDEFLTLPASIDVIEIQWCCRGCLTLFTTHG